MTFLRVLSIAAIYTVLGILLAPAFYNLEPVKDYYHRINPAMKAETQIHYVSRPATKPFFMPTRTETVYMDSFPKQYGSDLFCMAHNIYLEGRGEDVEGQILIGYVTMNRVKARSHGWPDDVCGVVFQRKAFSWTLIKPYINLGNPTEREAYVRAVTIAAGVLEGKYADKTKGATHYYSISGMKDNKKPWWSDSYKEVAIVGNHTFLK